MRTLPVLALPLALAAGGAFAQTPTMHISDAIQREGDHGTTPFVFTVSLSQPTTQVVRVKWFTESCTATPAEPCVRADYIPGDGVLHFAPGDTSRSFAVEVFGDTEREGQEVFRAVLSDAENAVLPELPQGEGQGIILNDDGPLPGPPVVDFSGDGHTDILWRHRDSNRLVAWFMDGLVRVGSAYITAGGVPAVAPPDAELAAAADFDGDGDADLVFQHLHGGGLEYWHLDGTVRGDPAFRPGQADLDWKIVGSGRFNADSHADLMWRHQTSGRMQVWYMNDQELLGTADLQPPFVPTLGSPETPDLNWRVAGLGDFDGDGRTDLLFRHEVTERLVFWLMDGVVKTAGGYFTPDRPVQHELWDVARVWDVDEDGITDLVFRHEQAGTLVAWLMNERQQRVCGTYLNPPALPDQGWRMVGPR